MNVDRYRSYLFISQVFRSDLFNSLERDVLADAAEGLLLAQDPTSPEIEELELNVEAALDGMTVGGRIRAATATELRERIHECGPRELTLAA